jgi:hypothetical protein
MVEVFWKGFLQSVGHNTFVHRVSDKMMMAMSGVAGCFVISVPESVPTMRI